MRVLSLFDGISCGRLALDMAEIPCSDYIASEVSKKLCAFTQAKYPAMKHVGDVTQVKGSDLGQIDLLVGGSPCQGISLANKNSPTLDHETSKLFFEYIRLLKETNPRWFLFENVPTSKAIEAVMSGCFGSNPHKINSSDFCAQHRRRNYWTNIPVAPITNPSKQVVGDILELGITDPKAYFTETASARVDRDKFRYKGKPYLPVDLNAKTRRPLTTGRAPAESRPLYVQDVLGKRWYTPRECERLQMVPDDYTEGLSKTMRYHALGNGWTIGVIAHILKGIPDA